MSNHYGTGHLLEYEKPCYSNPWETMIHRKHMNLGEAPMSAHGSIDWGIRVGENEVWGQIHFALSHRTNEPRTVQNASTFP